MAPFSVTLVTAKIDEEVKDLEKAAQKLGVHLHIRNVLPDEKTQDFDKVVLWRGSSVGKIGKRTAVLQRLSQNHFLINPALALYPNATKKSFQQSHFSKGQSKLKAIPTFTFSTKEAVVAAVTEKKLAFPLIEKPDIGNRGKGVRVIRSADDLPTDSEYYAKRIYQPFITNSGDFRVLIVGGKALGVMKRTAPENSLINNLSRGGSAEAIEDPVLKKFLCGAAEAVAKSFSLLICGVDIIQDDRSGDFYFLEINTIPQWQGFQKATGINVAESILLYCGQILKRETSPTYELVLENYKNFYEVLRERKFHFLSRMYLWTNEPFYSAALKEMEAAYLGKTSKETEKLFRTFLTTTNKSPAVTEAQKLRTPYYEKYPMLESYNTLLYKNLVAHTLYNRTLSPEIEALVPSHQLEELRLLLLNDLKAVRILSTPAINFLYLSSWYLGHKEALAPSTLQALFDQENFTSFSPAELKLRLYLLTHCIIGETLFYNRALAPEQKQFYRSQLEWFDQIIQENFIDVSLDMKLEFLVCARITEYASRTRAKILEEAERSLAPYDNYIIDTYNAYSIIPSPQGFVGSEHRNVLYLMATLDSPHYPFVK